MIIKKNLLLSLLFFTVIYADSQPLGGRDIYFKLGLTKGSYFGGLIALEYISKKNILFTYCYEDLTRISRNLPSDFSTNNPVSFLVLGTDYPQDALRQYTVTVGKVLFIENSTIRYNLKAGLGYLIYTYPTNFVKYDFDLPFLGNYSYDHESKHYICLIVDPSIDFCLKRYVGLSAGLTAKIYPKSFSATVHISILLGMVKNLRK